MTNQCENSSGSYDECYILLDTARHPSRAIYYQTQCSSVLRLGGPVGLISSHQPFPFFAKMLRVKFRWRFISELSIFRTRLYTIGLRRAYVCYKTDVEDICTAWRKGLGRVWGLPYRTHSALLYRISNMLPLKYELAYRACTQVWRVTIIL